jgi:hypothetical protein
MPQCSVGQKVFTTRPFNLDLPSHPDKSSAKITKETFKQVLETKTNWFVKKHFETIFKQDLPFDKKKQIKEDYFLPTEINKDLCSSVKLDPTIRSYKWGKSPSPTLLFEMMFAVFGYQPLLDTFNVYLQAFEGTSRFYNPLWLSLYVFLPVIFNILLESLCVDQMQQQREQTHLLKRSNHLMTYCQSTISFQMTLFQL